MMLALVIGDDWYPIIGDPTWIGWFTAFWYFASALACWKAAVAARQTRPRHIIRAAAVFWYLLMASMIFLGFNKQLDLQTWLTNIGRRMAKAEGWYDNRQAVQVVFIGLVLVMGLGVLGIMAWLSRGRVRRHLGALAGGVFLGVFIMVRAASFHHIDRLLGVRLGGATVNEILELGGITCLGLSAVRNWFEFCREFTSLQTGGFPEAVGE